MAKDNQVDDFPSLRDARIIPVLGGLGGNAAAAGAQSTSGAIGGTIGGGLLPFSIGGSVAGSQSTAAAGSGGGFGLLG